MAGAADGCCELLHDRGMKFVKVCNDNEDMREEMEEEGVQEV
jgi:hypothetical protein